MCEPIFKHVRDLITEKQHGFMWNRSTTSNLFLICQIFENTFDKHGEVNVFYTDFTKA